jgi:hypothetical protein
MPANSQTPPTGDPFFALQTSVFDTVGELMGQLATWGPSAGGPIQTAKVLFRNPTRQMEKAGIQFDSTFWTAEYKQNDFPGLKEVVDTRATNEALIINGVTYNVRAVELHHDGRTLVATLQPFQP